MRRLWWLPAIVLLAACTPRAAASSPSVTARPPVTLALASPAPSPPSSDQDAVLGPGGMTLRQEIGAVMMVGFTGPLTPAVLRNWRQRQFGGLILVPINQNAPDPAEIRKVIASVRSVMAHPLLAATNQEGGTICFPQTRVPCLAGASQAGSEGPGAVQSEMTTMAAGLKALGFDINVAPVVDLSDVLHPVMHERSYGLNPRAVAADVTAAIAGMHAAGMYAAAQTLATGDLEPLKAAIAAHVDLVMIGYLNGPSVDSSAGSSMLTLMHTLRSRLGYQGVVISDDLDVSASNRKTQSPAAAVRFLENGGDMVIVSQDLDVADVTYDAIHAAVLDGAYSRAQLDASVQKLLNLGLRFMP